MIFSFPSFCARRIGTESASPPSRYGTPSIFTIGVTSGMLLDARQIFINRSGSSASVIYSAFPVRQFVVTSSQCISDWKYVSKSNGINSFGYLSKIRSIFIRLFSLIVSFTPFIYFISFVFGIMQSLVRPGCLET